MPGSLMCVLSLVLNHPTWDNELHVGKLRHGNANSPKVTQLGGMKLCFKPRPSGSSDALHHHANCCLLNYALCLSTTISYLV